MPWAFDGRARRYRDSDTGRFLSRDRALEFVQSSINASGSAVDTLAGLVSNGMLSPADWRLRMREEIKTETIRQAILGQGGRAQMTAEAWGSVGGTISDQYRHLDRKLDNFYGQVLTGELSEGTIAARSRMYINSAREAYERGLKRRLRGSDYDEERWNLTAAESCPDCLDLSAMGWVPLGDFGTVPGAGTTQCLCITSPYSRVLTIGGWKPLYVIRPGEYVLTHRMRWRRVQAIIVKPSRPEHKQIHLLGPTGQLVGATDTHLWWSGDDFSEVSNIGSLAFLAYNYRESIGGNYHAEAILSELRTAYPFGLQVGRELQAMPVRLSMREAKGLSGRTMQELFKFTSDDGTVVHYASQNAGWSQKGRQAETDATRGYLRGHELAEEARWPVLDLLLGRWKEADDLSLSVGMDATPWGNTGWLRSTPCQPEPGGRSDRKFAAAQGVGPSKTTREIEQGQSAWRLPTLRPGVLLQGIEAQRRRYETGPQVLFEEVQDRINEAGAEILSSVRQDVLCQSGSWKTEKVLLGGMLPEQTALYDLVVEEDHSFCIEGLFAHNTNCKCYLSYRVSDTGEMFEEETERVAAV